MGWSRLDVEDAIIIAILLLWMTLDRFGIYFRKPKGE
jgi:hypothetical protein